MEHIFCSQVGLAVGDIQAIQDEAELRSNLLQVSMCIYMVCIIIACVTACACVLSCDVMR